MRLLMVLCLVTAFIIAGATWLIVPSLMRQPAPVAQEAPKPAPVSRVLVAAQNLPAGTIVKPEHVRWQAWPENGLSDGFIVEGKTPEPMKNIVAAAVRRGFTAGEPITETRLVQKGEAGFLAAALTPSMRAVSIKIDAVSGTSGFILPGDRVDVMLTSQYEIAATGEGQQRDTKSYAEIVLSDARVLAIDQNMKDVGDEKTPAKLAATATLEVTLHQAQVIGVASQLGRLTLVLAGIAQSEEAESPKPAAPGFVEEVEVSRFLKAMKKGAPELPSNGADSGGKSITVWRGTTPSPAEVR
jgi:pilus assembly protein CpaB